MTSIGETLRHERLKRKLNLEGVSNELKISARLLEAIEDEHFDKLPGGVFTKSFVRQYARLLGLDEDEISSELQRILDPNPQPFPSSQAPGRQPDIPLPRVEEWEAVGEKRSGWSKSLPALAMVVVMMLVCSAVYSWWQRTRLRVVAHETAPAAVQAPVAPPPQATRPADVSQGTGANPQNVPAASATAESRKQGSAEPQTTPAASVNAPPGPALETAIRVEMTAEEPVWIRIQGDGKYLFSGTLQANESRTAQANVKLTLRVGNAGGIHISVNGKPIGPVGPKGQIRDVQLTSGGFQILVPEPPKPAPPSDSLDPL